MTCRCCGTRELGPDGLCAHCDRPCRARTCPTCRIIVEVSKRLPRRWPFTQEAA